MISTECRKCPFDTKCPMREKHQRKSYVDGGLSLCPKFTVYAEVKCSSCQFRESSMVNIGQYHCTLLGPPNNVTRVVHRKTKCPLAAQIRKERT